MNIGKIIKDIRKEQNVKQITLAQECGITQTYLSQIENSQKEPNLSLLKKIASLLNIPLPIMFFLSMDNEDIALEKREAYNLLAPSIKSLLYEFFNGNNSHKNT